MTRYDRVITLLPRSQLYLTEIRAGSPTSHKCLRSTLRSTDLMSQARCKAERSAYCNESWSQVTTRRFGSVLIVLMTVRCSDFFAIFLKAKCLMDAGRSRNRVRVVLWYMT